ncbi:nimX [Symbiodinium microadriaticum]|nr:nimX [Symbiodinium microadriaticum]
MATGRPLFAGDSEIDTIFRIFQKLGTPTEEVWPGLTKLPDFKPSFPRWPAQPWSSIRNTAAQVGEDGIDLLEKLMYYDPRMASIVICKNMKRDFTNGVIIIFVFIIINHQQPQQ